jgi:hypothetical protein
MAPEIEIYSIQGHDPITSLRHYQSLSFTDYEMRDIEKRLIEWEILEGEFERILSHNTKDWRLRQNITIEIYLLRLLQKIWD